MVIDFDGVVAKPAYHNDPNPAVMPGAKRALDQLASEGFMVLIHSGRSWSGWGHRMFHDDMVRWLKRHRIKHHAVVTEKVPALAYVDDRAQSFGVVISGKASSNWDHALAALRVKRRMRKRVEEASSSGPTSVADPVRVEQSKAGRAVRESERGLQQGH